MQVISIITQKGGCAKTTSTINLAAAFQRKGKNVLLVDLDPQGSMSFALGIAGEPASNIASELLKLAEGKNANLGLAIVKTETGLPLVPYSASLSLVENKMRSKVEREKFLKRLIASVEKEYDLVLIDCASASARDLLSQNAIAASDHLIMPVQSEYLSQGALEHFMAELHEVLEDDTLNPKVNILGMVLTRYEGHKKMHREILDSLKQQYGNKLFHTWIRTNIVLSYAQQHRKDIFSYAPRSHAAEDYTKLADEVLSKIN